MHSPHLCVGLGRFRNRHEAAQVQARHIGHRLRQFGQRLRAHARFGLAAVYIHLNAHLQGRQMGRALLGQALGDFEAVHAVHPVKVFSHQTRLVALDGADTVPHQRQITQGHDLVHRLLDVVFAKSGLTPSMGCAHRLRAPGFGDGQQRHAVCRAASRLASSFNLRPDMRQVFGNGGVHGLSVPNPEQAFLRRVQLSPIRQIKAPGMNLCTARLLN